MMGAASEAEIWSFLEIILAIFINDGLLIHSNILFALFSPHKILASLLRNRVTRFPQRINQRSTSTVVHDFFTIILVQGVKCFNFAAYRIGL